MGKLFHLAAMKIAIIQRIDEIKWIHIDEVRCRATVVVRTTVLVRGRSLLDVDNETSGTISSKIAQLIISSSERSSENTLQNEITILQ